MEESFNQETWEIALARLKSVVDKQSFTAWLQSTKFHALKDNVLVLDVPSSFYKNWINSNYREKILRVLREITERDLELDFHVGNYADADAPAYQPGVLPAEGKGGAAAIETPRPLEFPRATFLNSKYTFDLFVVGESNRFAHAACRQVADPSSKSYNPLLLYGGVGLGKTHLMHAIGHQLLQINPQARVLYVTSEQFMNSFIETIAQSKMSEFRDFYRTVDLLLIDDVQFFGGKERTQDEFFHTFNALYDAGKKLVISSDRSPKELTALTDRVRNRLQWGLMVDIQPPDLETRIAILKKKAASEAIDLPDEVALYMAERVQSNIRELEGVLIRLKAYSSLHSEIISLELARQVVGHLLESEAPKNIDIDDIIEEVCKYFEIKRPDLIGSSRLKKFSNPRHIAQYLSRKLTPLSYPDIADRFGGRDHTSVLHAVRKIDDELTRDENMRNVVAHLTKRIRSARL